jgi:tetratricopeptide (TPR) repeat protein
MQTALALFREVEERPHISTTLINLGLAPFDADPNALLVNEETWILLSAMSGAALVGYTLAHLGAQARAVGDLDTACARLKESVAWFRTRHHQSGLAHCLGQLGAILRARGEFASAHALLEESLALRRQLGDRRGVGMTLNNMALLKVAEGECADAETLLAQVMASFVEMGDQSGIEMTRDLQAFVALRMGDHQRALALYQECLANYQARGHGPLDFACALTGMGAAAAAGGAPETARACFHEAAKRYEGIGDERGAASLRYRPLIVSTS